MVDVEGIGGGAERSKEKCKPRRLLSLFFPGLINYLEAAS